MKKLPLLLIPVISILMAGPSFSQDTTTKKPAASPKKLVIKGSVDLPVTIAAAGWTMYGFASISQKDGSSEAAVTALKKSDIPWFDRWAQRPYSRSVDKASYLPFYAAVPYPPIFFALDKRMRKDYVKLTFLYLQAMSVTGAFYTSAVHYLSRYRPLVYSSESPMNVRVSANARNAFFAGHVALVATSTFFMARVFADYHPDSHWKWVVYGAAGAATAATAYMRSRAGEHFPSDIFVGTTIGVLSGLLTPHLHEEKLIHNQRLSILPFAGSKGGQGLSLLYKL